MRNQALNRIWLALLLCIVLGWIYYLFGVESFLRSAYEGTSWGYFNDFASNWKSRNPSSKQAEFLSEAHALLFRFGFLTTLLSGAAGFLFWNKQKSVRAFFNEPESAFPLGLLRVFTFSAILALFDFQAPLWYSGLPDVLMSPPPGWGALAPLLPFSSASVSAIQFVFIGSCIAGLMGLFSRTSALVATMTGIYVLGVPQLFGKVIHYHHLLWFTALLSVSRSGAVLSVDGLWCSQPTPNPSLAFSRPIRFVWILIALIYFFPGFWKAVGEGLSWAFSDNLKYRMHILWFADDGFSPLFRIDQYPLLYRVGGLATIVFEISVLFSLPFSKWRHIAVVAALLFHVSTSVFLNIHFISLIPFLVFLIDIDSIRKRLGQWLAPQPVLLLYQRSDPFQRRMSEALSRMDLFDRLQLLQIRDVSEKPDAHSRTASTSQTVLQADMLWRRKGGIRRWLNLLHAVPTALPIVPLLFLDRKFGIFSQFPNETRPAVSLRTRAVTTVGALLVAANVLCGLGHVDSWPFAVYPTFAVQSVPTTTTLQIVPYRADDTPIDTLVTARSSGDTRFTAPRLRGLTKSVLRTQPSDERTEKLRALWNVWKREISILAAADGVHFYKATYNTNPDVSPPPLLKRQLIAKIDGIR